MQYVESGVKSVALISHPGLSPVPSLHEDGSLIQAVYLCDITRSICDAVLNGINDQAVQSHWRRSLEGEIGKDCEEPCTMYSPFDLTCTECRAFRPNIRRAGSAIDSGL